MKRASKTTDVPAASKICTSANDAVPPLTATRPPMSANVAPPSVDFWNWTLPVASTGEISAVRSTLSLYCWLSGSTVSVVVVAIPRSSPTTTGSWSEVR